MRDRSVIRIRYIDAAGVSTTRAVEATGFTGAADGWYPIGWCRLREAGRMFRLDRIDRATLTHDRTPWRDLDDAPGCVPHTVARP